ncbi:MAG: class I SAM-dependent methyltransferase [Gammaproteobacteria bacterium]
MSNQSKTLQDIPADKIYHWHSPIDLGNGVNTNRKVIKRFQRRLKLMQIPEDLSGKTVLDIGAWDGFFSFEFEKRGAQVLAIDTYAWDQGGINNFLHAREKLNSNVQYKRLDVHDLDPKDVGQFDIVFFAGVLYHLRNPLLALDRIRSVTKERLICETHAMIPFMHEKYPLISFFPGDENATAPWPVCGYATTAWLQQALGAAGFSHLDFKYTPSFKILHKFKALLTNRPQSGRCIIHAFP